MNKKGLASLVEGLPPTYWLIWIGTLINRLGGFVIPFLTLYLTAQREIPVSQAALMVSLFGAGILVTALAPPDRRDAIASILFAETTTIGVRYQEVLRERLAREIRTIHTDVGPVRFKIASRDGRVVNAAPEFDDCARIAAEKGLPVKEVQALALKAWLDVRGFTCRASTSPH